MSERKLYSAYNGLTRVAMVMGVPFMAALAVCTPVLMVTLVLAAIFGPGGLLFVFVMVPIFIYVKALCETDDQALRILWLEILCRLRRRYAYLFGKSLTITPIKYGRRLSVYRDAFKDNDVDSSRHE